MFARPMDLDRRVQRLAETQNGHITFEQARELGFTSRLLHTRRTSGGWVEVMPRVYRLPGVPETYAGSLYAIQLWMGTDGFFCGPTAAWIQGLDGVSRPDQIWVARYSGASHPQVRARRLSPSDRPRTRWRDGLRICNTERTLGEVAGILPARTVGLAVDDALRRRLTTLDRLDSFLENEWSRGRRGAKTLRKILRGRDLRDERVRSAFEAQMLRILKRIKVHRFEADHHVEADGERFVIDFFQRDALLGIECHSARWHLGREFFARDARRQRKIASLGIELLYFTWDEVFFESTRVEAEIVSAVNRRLTPSLPPGSRLA